MKLSTIMFLGFGLWTASHIFAQEDNQITMNRIENTHPMLAVWGGPYGGVPPWDRIDIQRFEELFSLAIGEATGEIDAIANSKDTPTFENTIVAMEKSARPLSRLMTLFDVHSGNLNVGQIPEIEKAVSPKLAAYDDSITQNTALFARIQTVYESDEYKTRLTTAQKRLAEDYFKRFVRNGAKLTAEQKKRLSEINQRLATLFTEFSQNVLADEEKYVTWVDNAKNLSGLPEDVRQAMAAAARERGKNDQWAITNTRSSMDPFLTYADNRELREKVWRTYYSRADNGDEHDNNKIIREILKLRAERAKLLGYATHAHWRLEPQMAKTPEAAMALLMSVWPKAVERVRQEVVDMQAIADQEQANIKIEPWDYRYYAEKVRKAKYDLDLNEVKPYMQLENLREAMMWAATQLYGLHFAKIDDVPVFHPDVTVYKVTDVEGNLVGLWYLDPYARVGKRSGAWMTDYREQESMEKPIQPIVSNNSNFIKGESGKPVLISWDDAVTLFHEFGHALHSLNSKVTYPSQAGTNVARDYVEFPSQLNEHWLTTPEVMNQFAVHYETNAVLPKQLFEKIKKADTFNQGFSTVEYLASALIDMKIHLAGGIDIDPDAFERETLAELGMPTEVVMRHRTPHFSHIFSSDGYSAGYYSYLWSDALTADAAEAFEETGGYYDKEVAKRLHDYVMSVGDTIDPAEGYRKFRGRDVDTKALLRKRGFPVE